MTLRYEYEALGKRVKELDEALSPFRGRPSIARARALLLEAWGIVAKEVAQEIAEERTPRPNTILVHNARGFRRCLVLSVTERRVRVAVGGTSTTFIRSSGRPEHPGGCGHWLDAAELSEMNRGT